MIWLSLIGFFISAIAAGGVVRWARDHTQHYGEAMPQRFHAGQVPRLGGVAMFAAYTTAWLWMLAAPGLGVANQIHVEPLTAIAWWITGAIAVAGGIYEDLTQVLTAR